MYIYLSDRKRRLYLSQASPQNLSPKRNLSRKDRRFLQKNVANIQDSLSVRCVKQQKVLYSKHIGSLIEPAILSRKTELLCNLHSKRAIELQKTKEKEAEIFPPFYLQVWEKQSNLYRTHALTLSSKSSFSRAKTAEHTLQIKQKKPANIYAFSALSVYVQTIKTYAENCFTDIQKKPSLYFANQSRKNRMPVLPRKQEGFMSTARSPSFVLHSKESKSARFLDFALQNPQDMYKHGKESVLKTCLHMPFLAFSICRTLASAPLYANGKSSYFYSRYLYNIESLKTSIMPQILQNQKTASRYKYILHERKKIAYLYGQLAKKDMQNLLKNASALPGLFEDNVFALLESRVDVLVHRAGFSNSIAGARQLIRNGNFYINGKKICSCKTRAFPGDFLALCSAKPKKREGLLYNCYIHTTEQLYNLYTYTRPLTKQVSKDTKQIPKIDNKKKILYMYLFLYKTLCKKDSLPWFSATCKTKEHLVDEKAKQKSANQFFPYREREEDQRTALLSKISAVTKGTGTHLLGKGKTWQHFNTEKKGLWCNRLLNSCSAHILKYKAKQRQFFLAAVEKEVVFHRFMKNIQNANSASIWGQKPLHLEISHKRGCFIYMYRPQKIIFPVSLDLHAIKGTF